MRAAGAGRSLSAHIRSAGSKAPVAAVEAEASSASLLRIIGAADDPCSSAQRLACQGIDAKVKPVLHLRTLPAITWYHAHLLELSWNCHKLFCTWTLSSRPGQA